MGYGGKRLDEDGHLVYLGMWWKFALPPVILAVNGALIVAALWFAHSVRGVGAGELALGVLAGFLVWTPFEYILHRWILHHTRVPFLKRILWDALHREHHSVPTMKEPDYHSIHLALSFPVVFATVGLTALLSQSGFGIAVAVGWTLGFCSYEGMHWVTHKWVPPQGPLRVPWLRFLYDVHVIHHFIDARKNYGFVTMFWDRCFRTYMSPAEGKRKRPAAF